MIAERMRLFVAVAEAGSFTSAGAALGVSQSTVSKQIAALEAELAVRLFRRTTRSLALSAEGERFYEASRQALAAIDEAKARVGTPLSASGLLRVTCPQSLAERKVTAMIARFLKSHPGISIDLVVADRALNLVADNLDVAIRVGQLADSSLIGRRIGLARRMLAAAPGYLERHPAPAQPADLRGHRGVLYSLLGTGSEWRFVGGHKVKITGAFRANCPSSLRIAALEGLGIVQSARWLLEDDVAAGRLVEVLPGFEPEPMPIHAVLPTGRHVSSRTRLFLDHLAASFARDPMCAPA